MGLAIIKKVVDGKGGETTIASALGKGSVLHSAGPQIRHAVKTAHNRDKKRFNTTY
jgi:hypothetical protein